MTDSSAQEFVFEKVKRDWYRRNISRNPLRRLFHTIIQRQPYTTIYVEQFRYADWVFGRCLKDRIQTWRYSGNLFENISSWGEVDSRSAVSSTTPVYSFCVNDDCSLMVFEEWHGRLSASGRMFRHDATSGKWKLQRRCWVS